MDDKIPQVTYKTGPDALQRHLSTIGIGDVFLVPPPHLSPARYLASRTDHSFVSWETTGILKKEPEDFIVHEIGLQTRNIPNLTDAENKSILLADRKINEHPRFPLSHEKLKVAKTETAPETINGESNPDVQPPASKDAAMNILELLRRTVSPSDAPNEDICNKLSSLQGEVSKALVDGTLLPSCDPVVLELRDETTKEDRGKLHNVVCLQYPFLRTESTKSKERSTIHVLLDESFLGLAKHLVEPCASLTELYTFYKTGYVDSPDEYSRSRKRRKLPHASSDSAEEQCGRIVLKLNGVISKDERREVHSIIDRQSKGKLSSHTLESDASGQRQVAVFWSKKAQNMGSSRRGRGTRSSGLNATLFVLRKRQREHLFALQTISKSLGCRLSDLTAAGIKDLQAVTYQFLTARGVSTEMVLKARGFLSSNGFDIGRVHPVNFILNTGDLEGNGFEILLRSIRRINVSHESTLGIGSEKLVHCDSTHIDDMVERIRTAGFVNFFGEQRVGDAGLSEITGPKNFEVGRAILACDFKRVVHLIMSGRTTVRGGGASKDDIMIVRKTWKDSDGDPFATWKALPHRGCLQRERLILKSLKRHGKDKYEEALQSLPHSQQNFWINSFQSYVWNRMTTERLETFGTKPVTGDLFFQGRDIAVFSGQPNITIFEVVLPLPGRGIRYPENDIGNRYRDLLKAEGVDLEISSRHVPKGAYRNLVVRTKNLNHEMLDDNLKLSFELPKGSYATMMLRELMVTTVVRVTAE